MTWCTDDTFTIAPGRSSASSWPTAGCLHLLHAHLDPAIDRVLGGLRTFGLTDVVDGHVHAFLAESDGDGLSDAGAAPGHECGLAFEASHRCPPSSNERMWCLLCGDGPGRYA